MKNKNKQKILYNNLFVTKIDIYFATVTVKYYLKVFKTKNLNTFNIISNKHVKKKTTQVKFLIVSDEIKYRVRHLMFFFPTIS